MLNIEFEKELGKNYMVLKGQVDSYDYSVRMVRENKTCGLLAMDVSNIDGNPKYYYEIDGFLQLEKYYAMRSMGHEDIERILLSIISLPQKLEEYLLNKDYILLSPSTIFLDSEGEPHYVYYPNQEESYAGGIKKLCTFMLRKLDHQDEKAVNIGYSAFEISNRENFALSDFNRLIHIKENVDIEPEAVEDEDDILKIDDDSFGLDFSGMDLFEEEDIEDEADDEEMDDELMPYQEKKSPKEVITTKLLKYGPFALILIIGLFLFLSSSMSLLSLPLRIVSFVMISVAILLISYLLKGKI